MLGTVMVVEAGGGDAQIQFDDIVKMQWVLKTDFHKLQAITPKDDSPSSAQPTFKRPQTDGDRQGMRAQTPPSALSGQVQNELAEMHMARTTSEFEVEAPRMLEIASQMSPGSLENAPEDFNNVMRRILSKKENPNKDSNLRRRVLYEVQYPLMEEKNSLYVKFPQDYELKGEEEDWKDCIVKEYTTFGSARKKGSMKLIIAYADRRMWKVFFDSARTARAEMESVMEREEITFMKPGNLSARKTHTLFMNNVVIPNMDKKPDQVTETDVQEFLEKIGAAPIDVNKLVTNKPDKSDMCCLFCLKNGGSQKWSDCIVCMLVRWQTSMADNAEKLLSHVLLDPASRAARFCFARCAPAGMAVTTAAPGAALASKDSLKDVSKPSKPAVKEDIAWRLAYDDEEILWRAKMIISTGKESKRQSLDTTTTNSHAVQVVTAPDPFTQGLVICFRTSALPRELFRKLMLHRPADEFPSAKQLGRASCVGDLVEEFEYTLNKNCKLDEEDLDDCLDDRARAGVPLPHFAQKGDVHYSIDVWESKQNNYARLITPNWWYATLCKTLLIASLTLMDLYSSVIYSSNLFKTVGPPVPGMFRSNAGGRYNFVVTFFILEAIHFSCCLIFAFQDIQGRFHGGMGGIVRPKKLPDLIKVCLSIFLFYLVQMPRSVRDLVVTLHPHTFGRQKAAVKLDGTRVFIIGYPSEVVYRVNSAQGENKQAPPILVARFFLTMFKVCYAYQSRSWLALMLCLTGVILWPLQVISLKNLIKDRRAVFDNVRDDVEEHFETAPEDMELLSLQTKNDELMSNGQKRAVKDWASFFPDHKTLARYSLYTDLCSREMWCVIISLLVVNISIGALQHGGVLTSGTTMHVDSLLAADVNGDGMLSATELAAIGLSFARDRVAGTTPG